MKVHKHVLRLLGFQPFVLDPPTEVRPEDQIILRLPLKDESIAEIQRADGQVLYRKVILRP